MTMYVLNGKQVTREEFLTGAPTDSFLERPPMTANTYTEHNPLISEAMRRDEGARCGEGCEKLKERGIQGVAVLDNGQIRFTSRQGHARNGIAAQAIRRRTWLTSDDRFAEPEYGD